MNKLTRDKSEVLKALGHPVRLQMVTGLLLHNECNVQKMVAALNLPQSTVSQHLAVLKSRGIVELRRDGVRSCYRLADERMVKLVKTLSQW
jgi:ArsR family transcriptional regulator